MRVEFLRDILQKIEAALHSEVTNKFRFFEDVPTQSIQMKNNV